MKECLLNYLKWKIAPKEMLELRRIKRRADEVKVWCSEFETARVVSEYIENPKRYPYQSMGCHGDIADFRQYVKLINNK